MTTPNPWLLPLTDAELGGYHLDKCIGIGGFCLVFEVTKVDTGSQFAMKVLPPSPDASAQVDFDNEAMLLRKLSGCGSVVNLIESSSDSLQVTLPGGMTAPVPIRFHVLSLASASLEELILAPGTLDRFEWRDRIRLWRGAIKGVHQMHLKSVAHRDLKSSNCLLMISGAVSEVRLTDLGRSKDLHQPPIHHPLSYLSGLGDFRFAPPEYLWLQGGNMPDDFRNADLYGLGSLLAELATGHPMTALAMTSWSDARKDGMADLAAGVVRDLTTLRPQFRAAIDGLTDEMPAVIRRDAAVLLSQICDPVPDARQPRRPLGKASPADPGLLWLLRRADIMQAQLAVAPRRRRYINRSTGRTA